MATARSRFFRVEDSILRDPVPRDVKLTGVLLRAWLHQRWARDGLSHQQACEATLSRAALAEITGRSQLAHARRALRALGACEELAIQVRGEFTEISWPKFAELLPAPSETRATIRPGNAPTNTNTKTYEEDSNSKGLEEVADELAAASGQVVPDRLSPKDRERFGRWLHRHIPPLWEHRAELESRCLDHYRKNSQHAGRMRSWLAACEGYAKKAWEIQTGRQTSLWPAPVRRARR